MPTQRDVNIRIAVQDAQKALDQLKGLGVGGENAVKRIVTAYDTVKPAADRATDATDTFAARAKGSFGNVAAQLQDMVVQFQSGTNASIILAQQLPQMTAGFGAAGAVIGLVAAGAATAAGALLGLSQETDSASALTKLFSDTLDTNSDALRRNVERLAEADEATRRFAQTRAELAQKALLAGSTSDVNSLAGLVRNRAQAEFGPDLPLNTPGLFGSQTVDIERNLAGAQARGDVQRELKAAIEGGGGAKAVFEAADRLGLSVGASPATLDAIQAIADKANEYAANQVLIEAARTGKAPGLLPGETQSPFAKFAEGLDSKFGGAANTAKEKIAAVNAELAETLRKIDEFRKKGTDEGELQRAEQTARATAAREIAGIEEVERKRQEADAKRGASALKRADQEARKIAEVEAEVAGLKRLEAALGQSVDQYRLVENQLRAEREARALGAEATKDEIAAMTAAVMERERIKDAIAAEIALRKENEKLQLDEIDRFSKQSADRIEQMIGEDARDQRQEVQQLQRNLQQNVASALKRGFEDGFGSVGDLVDQFGSLLKSTVATALADQLVSEGLAKSISGALSTKIGELAPSLAGTRAGEVTVGGAATAGLGAAFGGYAVGQQFQGNRLYGTLGGVATGAAAGSAFGPYGAAAGAVIGGVAGFFGSGATGGERNNNFQGGFDPVTGRRVPFQNTKPDAANQGLVQGILAELETLRTGGRSLGLGFTAQELTLQAGNRTGLTLNGQRFDDAASLSSAALRQLLSGATGLSANQNRALRNSRGDTAAELLSDLDLARQLDDLAKGGGALGAQLRDNERQFAALQARAEELGLATKDIDRAQADQLAAFRETAQAQLGLVTPLQAAQQALNRTYAEAIPNAAALGTTEAALIAAREDALQATRDAALAQLGLVGPLEQAANQIAATFAEAVRNAAELNLSERELIRTRDERLRQVAEEGRDQYRARIEANYAYVDSLSAYRDSLAVGENGTDRSRFDAAKRQYQEIRAGVLAGDLDAIDRFQQVSQTYLGAARDYGASGAIYQNAFNDVNRILDRLITQGETREQRLLDGVGTTNRTLESMYRDDRRERAEMLEQLRAIERLLRNRAA